MGLPASEYSDRIVFSRKSGDRGPCLHPLGGLQGGYTLGQAQALIGGMKEAKPECQAIIFFFFFKTVLPWRPGQGWGDLYSPGGTRTGADCEELLRDPPPSVSHRLGRGDIGGRPI